MVISRVYNIFYNPSTKCTEDAGIWALWVKWVITLYKGSKQKTFQSHPKKYPIMHQYINLYISIYKQTRENCVWVQWVKWGIYSAQDESWAWLPVSNCSVFHSWPLCQISCFLQNVHNFVKISRTNNESPLNLDDRNTLCTNNYDTDPEILQSYNITSLWPLIIQLNAWSFLLRQNYEIISWRTILH